VFCCKDSPLELLACNISRPNSVVVLDVGAAGLTGNLPALPAGAASLPDMQ
jgi:hypothetical protein